MTMTDEDIRGPLGLAPDETTPERRAAIDAAYDRILARWPDVDSANDRLDAMTGALGVIFGDETLDTIAFAWRECRAAERVAHAAMTGALIATGGTEVSLAQRAGVTRMTVRKALGK